MDHYKNSGHVEEKNERIKRKTGGDEKQI